MSDIKRTLLIVEDDEGQRRILEGFLAARGYEVRSAPDAETALSLVEAETPCLVLMDVRMPGMGGMEGLARLRKLSPPPAVILLTAYADVRDAVEAIRHGALDYLEKPVDLEELATVVAEAIGVSCKTESMDLPPLPADFVVASEAMRRVVVEASLVASTEATVLITGESGTGKGRVAELIHWMSARREGAFVPVNCASIPQMLMESELFGHTKGSFCGADTDRVGRFEAASGGTVFLDEVADLHPEVQPNLLHVLENGTFERVGESRTRQADVRVVACTHRDLEREVASGTFREDLFWRLNVFRLHLPPLRQRPEEVVLLARHFLSRMGKEKPRLSPAAVRLLDAYRWPGNVREVANVMQRAAILALGGVILAEHLPPSLRGEDLKDPDAAPDAARGDESPITVEEAERRAIRKALVETEGNRTRAARLLGISRRTLLYRLKRYGETGAQL